MSSPRQETPADGSCSVHEDRGGAHTDIHHTHIASMFSGGNYQVTGGNFLLNAGILNPGFYLLSQSVSRTAMHNSGARDPPPRCHPETRKAVVSDILLWIKDPASLVAGYWVFAPFGHGKSAVMQTVIECLENEGLNYRFAGGFFFGRDKAQRDRIDYLFPTIAYQMACNLPGMLDHVDAAMTTDPTLPFKSVEVQLRSLIVEPLLNWSKTSYFEHPPVIIIDGLDECKPVESQITILQLIGKCLHDYHLPFRFLIASRPEIVIKNTIMSQPLKTSFGIRYLGDNATEMANYFASEFDKIYDQHESEMKASGIKKPWPSRKEIQILVKRACNQYVYAHTSMAFIGGFYADPVSQLEIILKKELDADVFSEMDQLYRSVLKQCPAQHRHIQSAVLAAVIYSDPIIIGNDVLAHPLASVSYISVIWQLRPGDVRRVVDLLSAVLDIQDHSMLLFHHLSFKEFLEDEKRSGEFFCDRQVANDKCHKAFLATLKAALTAELTFSRWELFEPVKWLLDRKVEVAIWSPSELAELCLQGEEQIVNLRDIRRFFFWQGLVVLLGSRVHEIIQQSPKAKRRSCHSMDGVRWPNVNGVETYHVCMDKIMAISQSGTFGFDQYVLLEEFIPGKTTLHGDCRSSSSPGNPGSGRRAAPPTRRETIEHLMLECGIFGNKKRDNMGSIWLNSHGEPVYSRSD